MGADFVASYWIMLGLGPRILMQTAVTVLQGNLAGRAYPLAMPLGQGLALAGVIIADLILIPVYGISGAVAGGIVGYIPCLLVVLLGFLRAEQLTFADFVGSSRIALKVLRGRILLGTNERAGRPG
jgi:hypothetical protein